MSSSAAIPGDLAVVRDQTSYVFLSYNSRDREAIGEVRDVLRALGVPSFIDSDGLVPGQLWFGQLEQALLKASAVLVFLGPNGLGRWQQYEISLAVSLQAQRPSESSYWVIPVLLPGAEPSPGFLGLHTWIDLRQDFSRSGILERCRRSFGPDSVPARVQEMICPYLGLRAFREEDSRFFFGRDVFVQELLAKLDRGRMIVVVGTSGSGKSSVVQAGLFPKLRLLDKTRQWDIVSFQPSADPLRCFADQILPAVGPSESGGAIPETVDDICAGLGSGTTTAAALVNRAVDHSLACRGVEQMLIFIDQFEELLTFAPESKRLPFLNAMLDLLEAAPCCLVITLRADFYSRAISLSRRFSDLLSNSIVNIGALEEKELHQVISAPASIVGLTLEDGLADRILGDIGVEPGNLPLLEFTLTELFPLRHAGKLTHDGYKAIGELSGSIAQSAERVVQKGASRERVEATRRLFLRLVRVTRADEDGSDTRRRALVEELDPASAALVPEFVEARLLVLGRHESSGAQTIEVAHEALLRHWSRLIEWVNKRRLFLLWRQEFEVFLTAWKRDPSSLLRGSQLAEAVSWMKNAPSDLNEQERRFILQSRTQNRRGIWLQWTALAAATVMAAVFLLVWFPRSRRAALVSEISKAKAFVEDQGDGRLKINFEADSNPDAALRYVRELAGVRSLDLGSTRVSDAGLAQVGEMAALNTLLLSGTKTTDAGIRRLQPLHELHTLDLSETGLSNAGLGVLSGFPNLQSLDISSTSVTSSGLAALKDLRGLRDLDVGGNPGVGDDGMREISGLVALRKLSLDSTQVTDAGLPFLAAMRDLRVIELTNAKISSKGVQVLAEQHPLLEELWIKNTAFDDEGMRAIEGLKKLRILAIPLTHVTDKGLVSLRHLTGLREFYVGGANIGDAGLTNVSGLVELRKLYVPGDKRVTDLSVQSLVNLTELRDIQVGDTGITQTGIDRLRKLLPKASVNDQ
jgi:hypothetical protein